MKQVRILLGTCIIVLLCSFAAAEWLTIDSAPGKFKLSFPRKPETTVQQTEKSGYKLTMHMYIYEANKYKDDNEVYMAMYCEYPDSVVNSDFKDELVDAILKGSINGMAEKMNGKVLSMENISYKGFPGRNVRMSVGGEGFTYVRIFLVHNHMYMMAVAVENKNDHNASIDTFFKSFVITEIR